MPPIPRRPRSRTEATIQDEIRAACARMPDVTLFRNAVGKMNVSGKWFSYGLGPGSADLVGWLCCAMPRGTIARFLALEVKDPAQPLSKHGKHVAEQEAWLANVRSCGGIAGMVTSVEEAVDLIERGRLWAI